MEDIDYVLSGYKPSLGNTLRKMLEDNAYLTGLRKVKTHYQRAKSILFEGTSKADARTWYGELADGGVVCLPLNVR